MRAPINSTFASKTFDSMAKALSGDRAVAPAAPRPQQDAAGQPGDRSRRAQSNGALAVRLPRPGRSQPKASEWIFSPCGMVEVPHQARTWAGDRLHRLVGDGNPDRGGAVRLQSRCSVCTPAAALTSSFAKRFDEAPPASTKKSHPHIHERYKVGCLGAQYSMQHVALAQRLGVFDVRCL